MEYVVLIDEPGKDIRALPGTFVSAADAMKENVSFQAYPLAQKFLVAKVVTEIA